MEPASTPGASRRWHTPVIILAGVGFVLAPRVWPWSDPYDDGKHIAMTIGIVLIVMGLVRALPGSVTSSPRMSSQASGAIFLVLGIALGMVSSVLFRNKGDMFLGAAGFLTALGMLGVGLVRLMRRSNE